MSHEEAQHRPFILGVYVLNPLSRVKPLWSPWLLVAHQALRVRNSPGKNTKVGGHSFLQGIFPDSRG